jgi:DNA helicase MCM8
MEECDEISRQENLFGLLVKSISPSIYGNHLVKAGLILALFGGGKEFSQKNGIL